MYNIQKLAAKYFGLVDDTPREKYKVLCPLHNDHKPSLTLWADGKWRCYTCEKGGGLYKLFCALWQCDEWEVLERLLPNYIDSETELCAQPTEVNDNGRALYSNNLRMVEDIVHQFPRNGVSYKGDDNHYLLSRGFLSRTLNHYKVCVVKHGNYQVLLPLYFSNTYLCEEVYGYQLRTTDSYVTPKYLTMWGVEKQQHLYGVVQSNCEVILVTEGRLDGMMAYQYNSNISEVSILGCVISDVQAKLLADLKPKVIIGGFDMDDAGNRASSELRRKMMNYNVSVVNLVLPRNDIASCRKEEFLRSWREVVS